MRIVPVTGANFPEAAGVYTRAWRKSHKGVCTTEFLHSRDCEGYLRSCMDGLYLLEDGACCGIVRILDGRLSDLYVEPALQGKGYGTALLRFAMEKSKGIVLTVLSSNEGAIRLYQRHGFRFTGRENPLKNGIFEWEMEYTEKQNG